MRQRSRSPSTGIASHRRSAPSRATGPIFSLAQRRIDFKAFCNWNHKGREAHPINCIDRKQAEEYCAFAGKQLPTSAQWEAATYGLQASRKRNPKPVKPEKRPKYVFGDALTPDAKLCWKRKDKRSGTCTRDSPLALDDLTRSGILGLAANVSEWTRSDACPEGADKCRNRLAVIRGGNWYNDYAVQVGNARARLLQAKGYDHTIGFRCVSR